MATYLRKVLEEQILNEKVKYILDEFLGITKHKFHELLLILLRKKQVPGENITSNAHRITVMKYEDVDK